jgi:hypothetical protein
MGATQSGIVRWLTFPAAADKRKAERSAGSGSSCTNPRTRSPRLAGEPSGKTSYKKDRHDARQKPRFTLDGAADESGS